MLYFTDLFDELFGDQAKSFGGNFKADLEEADGAYCLTVDIPGVDKKDVKLEYNDSYLTVSVNTKKTEEKKDATYLSRERTMINGSRSFYIEGIDEANIKAKFENGVLQVVMPKAAPAVENKKFIEIE